MKNILIKPADIKDSQAVSQCVDAAYAKYIKRIGKKPAPMLADYSALIGAGYVFVMFSESRLLGVLVTEPNADYLFIENIAVHPLYQGRGLGRRLMNYAEQIAANYGLEEIRLYTNELMIESIGFYRGLGYKETERRIDSGYSRVFMRKKL